MSLPSKCAHPSCECSVPAKADHGRFCSEHCRKAGQITELHCNCQHLECRLAAVAGPPAEHARP